MTIIEIEKLYKEYTLLKQLYALDRERYVTLVPRMFEIKQTINLSLPPRSAMAGSIVLWNMKLAESITKAGKEALKDLIKELEKNNIII